MNLDSVMNDLMETWISKSIQHLLALTNFNKGTMFLKITSDDKLNSGS